MQRAKTHDVSADLLPSFSSLVIFLQSLPRFTLIPDEIPFLVAKPASAPKTNFQLFFSTESIDRKPSEILTWKLHFPFRVS